MARGLLLLRADCDYGVDLSPPPQLQLPLNCAATSRAPAAPHNQPVNHHILTGSDGTAPEHPVFDANVLEAMFGPEPTLIASVLQTFVSSTRASLAELAPALAAHELDAVAALAHRIAGASRLSGALALGHCAHGVEQAAKRGDAAAVTLGVANLQAQWAQAQVVIVAQLAQH